MKSAWCQLHVERRARRGVFHPHDYVRSRVVQLACPLSSSSPRFAASLDFRVYAVNFLAPVESASTPAQPSKNLGWATWATWARCYVLRVRSCWNTRLVRLMPGTSAGDVLACWSHIQSSRVFRPAWFHLTTVRLPIVGNASGFSKSNSSHLCAAVQLRRNPSECLSWLFG